MTAAARQRRGISEHHIRFIRAQQLFFVATAAADGRVNLSPKGLDSLRILAPDRVVWLNLSGSGNETAAHVRENPRMTLMFCAFAGAPITVRVYGEARAVHPRDAAWAELAALFPPMAGARQIFDVQAHSSEQSCGSGVPFYDYQGQRGDKELLPFYAAMGEDDVKKYWTKKNRFSIDGKPTGIDDGDANNNDAAAATPAATG